MMSYQLCNKCHQLAILNYRTYTGLVVVITNIYRVFPRNNKVWAHGPMSLKFDGPLCNEWVNFFNCKCIHDATKQLP